MKVLWTQVGDLSVSRVVYANGVTHDWVTGRVNGKYFATVKTPEGLYTRVKSFGSITQAQRFAARFINRADGVKMLTEVLEKDFKN